LKNSDRILILGFALVILPFLGAKAQINSTLGWFEINYNQGCSPLEVSVKTAVSENDVPIFQFNGIDDPNPVAWRNTFDSLFHTYTSPGTYVIYLTIQTNNVIRQDSLSVTVLQSQTPVFDLKNCQNNGMEVDIQDNFYDSYIIDFGDGNSTTVNSGAPNPVHLYPDAQTYTVQVTGRLVNAPNNCGTVNMAFTPAPVILAPQINRMTVTADNDIELNFSLPQNVDYRFEASAGNSSNFQFFQLIAPSETDLTLSGFSPNTQQFCFRIAASDPCSGNLIYSNIVCTISTNLNITNNVNQLSWTTIEQGLGEESYQIGRNAIPDFIIFPAATFNFNDQQVNCNTDYCYSVSIQYSNGAESIAPTVCGTSFSTDIPPTLENLSVDIRTDGALITWDALMDIDTSYVNQRSPGGILLDRDTTTTNPAFMLIDLMEYPQTCYEHSYRDVCGNISLPTTSICSILLTGVGNPDGSINLSWTDFTGWKDSVQNYTVEKYSLEGDLIESIPLGLETTYDDDIDGTLDQIVKYVVLATPVDNTLPNIRSNEKDVARRAQLHYPDAFTPDGDGLNDVFEPKYLFIKEYNFNIYNRWGEVVYSADDITTGWDGLINGEKALEGSYTYLTKAEDFRGLKISRSGILLLLRK